MLMSRMLCFPALFHLLTKKPKKQSTRTLNQLESGSKNTSDDSLFKKKAFLSITLQLQCKERSPRL